MRYTLKKVYFLSTWNLRIILVKQWYVADYECFSFTIQRNSKRITSGILVEYPFFCFMQYNQSILKFQTNFNQFENLWNSRDYDNPSCLLLDDTNPLPVYFVQQIQIGWSSSWLRIPLHRLVFAKTAAPSLLYCTMKSLNLGIARKLKVN